MSEEPQARANQREEVLNLLYQRLEQVLLSVGAPHVREYAAAARDLAQAVYYLEAARANIPISEEESYRE